MKIKLFIILLTLSTIGYSQTELAITIDDFPMISMNRTPENQDYVMGELIKNLKQYDAPAIGFVNESKLYQDDVLLDYKVKSLEKWLKNGFELGNHGYSHLNFDNNDTTTYFADIEKGSLMTRPLCNKYNSPYRYYRHPYLHAGNTEEKEVALEKYLARNGYQEAPVTIDNGEWIFARAYDMALSGNDKELASKIGKDYVDYMIEKSEWYVEKSKELFDRPIKQTLLVHANNINADYLDDLLKAYVELNYEFIPLEEALKDEAYATNDHIAKPWGISWLHRWSRNIGVDKSFYKGEPKCPSYIEEYTGFSE